MTEVTTPPEVDEDEEDEAEDLIPRCGRPWCRNCDEVPESEAMSNPQDCDRCSDCYDADTSNHLSLCDYCYDNSANCERCDDLFWDSPYGYLCNSCGETEARDSELVHNYNYLPELNFLSVHNDPDPKLHLGIELEVATDYSRDVAQAIFDGPGRAEELLFCKEDGSINGVEIVTHPMTHAYFREQFPFGMFAKGGPVTRQLRWRRPNAGYGLHVHVSRAGFKSEAHTLRWLLLIYRNADQLSTLARRTPNQWTSFKDSSECIAKAKGRGGAGRYVAVNAENDDTYEVRVFRSSWIEQEFRAAVDFVHASVTYTRQLSAHDALRGGLTWDTFRAWVADKPEYSSLTAELSRLDGVDAARIDPDDSNDETQRIDVPQAATEPLVDDVPPACGGSPSCPVCHPADSFAF